MPLINKAGGLTSNFNINGSILKSYRVGKGETVSAGDFVEYLSGSDTVRTFIYEEGTTQNIIGVAKTFGSNGSNILVFVPAIL